MDRRDFLRTSGIAAAAAGLAACAPKAAEAVITPAERTLKTNGTMLQNYPGIGVLGYGCMRWPMIKDDKGNDVIDQEKVNELVDLALENGVNYFDTSPVYLRGQSEKATAEALNRHPRESWLLATKLSNFADASYDNSVLMYRNSLKIFKTDHIDYYLLHSVGSAEDFKRRFEDTGILDFLLREREKGNIRNLGFSIHSQQPGFDSMMELHPKYHWDFVQIQMNYLDWTHAGGRNTNAKYLYEELAARDIPVVIMEPLRGGGLAKLTSSQTEKLKAIEPDLSVSSWAFRFCGSFPKVMVALSGMTYREHLEDNLKTFLNFKPLVQEEFDLLEEIADQAANFPLVGCTGCQYCMPCPYGINIPGVFRFYDRSVIDETYVRNSEQKDFAKARKRYLAAYDKAVESVRQADHCIACGRCEKSCPQHIRIPRELGRIDAYIEAIKQGTL